MGKHVNDALAAAGFDARISAKAYKDTNPDLKPTVHLDRNTLGARMPQGRTSVPAGAKRNERIAKSNRLAKTYRQRASVGEATPENLRADALADSLIADLSVFADEVQADTLHRMSPEEAAAYSDVVGKVPNAEAVFEAMAPIRTGMGRLGTGLRSPVCRSVWTCPRTLSMLCCATN